MSTDDTPADDDGTETQTDDELDLEEYGLVTVPGGESVSETVARIESDVEESPVNLLTTVDHAENAASVDRELPPTTLLLVGNPDVGTPLMQASRSIAIDLPQKLLVWESDDGDVEVTYNDPQYLAERHGIEGQDERIETVSSVLEDLATGGD